jgi:hypothetical protein
LISLVQGQLHKQTSLTVKHQEWQI